VEGVIWGGGGFLGIWDRLGRVDNQTLYIYISFGTHHCLRFMSLYSFQTLLQPTTTYNKSFPISPFLSRDVICFLYLRVIVSIGIQSARFWVCMVFMHNAMEKRMDGLEQQLEELKKLIISYNWSCSGRPRQRRPHRRQRRNEEVDGEVASDDKEDRMSSSSLSMSHDLLRDFGGRKLQILIF